MRALFPLALVAAVGVPAGPAAASPRRGGKVVRVPRPLPAVSTSVRLCSLFDEGKAVCEHAVAVGEVGALIDDEGGHGQAIVRAVAAKADECGRPVAWDVEVEASGGGGAPRRGLLVLDHEVEDRTRLLPVPTAGLREGERVLHLVDSDGDGDGDLRIVTYPCDARGSFDRTTRASHHCTDTWLAVRDRWRLARAERVPVCTR